MNYASDNLNSSMTVIGLMSGTSLDGTDLCACRFKEVNSKWEYDIVAAETYDYPLEWLDKLRHFAAFSGEELIRNHAALGRYYGEIILDFVAKNSLKPDLIGSHGHTVFHQPELGFTFQAGDGQHIAAVTGVDTVYDFRSKDVGMGGQGAPLVPIGDHLLFPEHRALLNLGGIANISFSENGIITAFDIAPANMALNFLSEKTGRRYDAEGKIAARGRIIKTLLDELNSLSYYQLKGPKTLGREWFETNFLQILKNYPDPVEDLLHTVTEHIAFQVGIALTPAGNNKTVLVTGGGALNTFLIAQIRKHSKVKILLPDEQLIGFKEALVFGLLALLFVKNQMNVLCSATGSRQDHIGGAYCKGG